MVTTRPTPPLRSWSATTYDSASPRHLSPVSMPVTFPEVSATCHPLPWSSPPPATVSSPKSTLGKELHWCMLFLGNVLFKVSTNPVELGNLAKNVNLEFLVLFFRMHVKCFSYSAARVTFLSAKKRLLCEWHLVIRTRHTWAVHHVPRHAVGSFFSRYCYHRHLLKSSDYNVW